MEQHLLKIKANNEPATLEQLLRVVRFRGFKVDNMSMSVQLSDQLLDIQVSVSSQRPIRLLENQLLKLVSVRQVNVENSVALVAHA